MISILIDLRGRVIDVISKQLGPFQNGFKQGGIESCSKCHRTGGVDKPLDQSFWEIPEEPVPVRWLARVVLRIVGFAHVVEELQKTARMWYKPYY